MLLIVSSAEKERFYSQWWWRILDKPWNRKLLLKHTDMMRWWWVEWAGGNTRSLRAGSSDHLPQLGSATRRWRIESVSTPGTSPGISHTSPGSPWTTTSQYKLGESDQLIRCRSTEISTYHTHDLPRDIFDKICRMNSSDSEQWRTQFCLNPKISDYLLN